MNQNQNEIETAISKIRAALSELSPESYFIVVNHMLSVSEQTTELISSTAVTHDQKVAALIMKIVAAMVQDSDPTVVNEVFEGIADAVDSTRDEVIYSLIPGKDAVESGEVTDDVDHVEIVGRAVYHLKDGTTDTSKSPPSRFLAAPEVWY